MKNNQKNISTWKCSDEQIYIIKYNNVNVSVVYNNYRVDHDEMERVNVISADSRDSYQSGNIPRIVSFELGTGKASWGFGLSIWRAKGSMVKACIRFIRWFTRFYLYDYARVKSEFNLKLGGAR